MAWRSCAMSEKTLELRLPQHFAQELALQQTLTPELEQRLWQTQVLQQAQRQLTAAAEDDDVGFRADLGRWSLAPKIEIDQGEVKVGLLVSLQW